jgi:MFS family permease
LQLSCAALLGTLAWLWQSGIWPVLSIWHIIAISFVNGMAATLAAPAYQTLTLDLVGRQDLTSAIALNSAQFNVSRIVGPTLGGIVYSYSAIGLAGCFYFNSLSSLAVIAALRQVRVPRGLPPAPRATRDVIRQLIAGLRYVWGRPRVLALLGIASVVSICGLPYLTFMPVFARDVLGVDARGLGALWAAVGTGALTSALLLAAASDFRRRGWLLLIGAIFFGSAIIAFALSRGFWFSFFALMAVGGGMSAVATTVNTLLQSLVVDEMRGRVMSMYTLSVFGFAPLGSLLVGVLAQLIGPRGPYLGTQLALGATGVMIILYALVVLIRRPAVRALP